MSCRKEKQISKQKRYRHFQERISILVLFTTLEKKKKQATDKPYCLLHNNSIRKFSCFPAFFISALPQDHLLVPYGRQLSSRGPTLASLHSWIFGLAENLRASQRGPLRKKKNSRRSSCGVQDTVGNFWRILLQ